MNHNTSKLVRLLKTYSRKTHQIAKTAIYAENGSLIETVKKGLWLCPLSKEFNFMFPISPVENSEDITTIILREDDDIGVVSKLQIWNPMAQDVFDPFEMGYHSFIAPIHNGLLHDKRTVHSSVMGSSGYVEYVTKSMNPAEFVYSLDCVEPQCIVNSRTTMCIATYSLNIKFDGDVLRESKRFNTYDEITQGDRVIKELTVYSRMKFPSDER